MPPGIPIKGEVSRHDVIRQKPEMLGKIALPNLIEVNAERKGRTIGAVEPLATGTGIHHFQITRVHAPVLIVTQGSHMGQLPVIHVEAGSFDIGTDIGANPGKVAGCIVGKVIVIVQNIILEQYVTPGTWGHVPLQV